MRNVKMTGARYTQGYRILNGIDWQEAIANEEKMARNTHSYDINFKSNYNAGWKQFRSAYAISALSIYECVCVPHFLGPHTFVVIYSRQMAWKHTLSQRNKRKKNECYYKMRQLWWNVSIVSECCVNCSYYCAVACRRKRNQLTVNWTCTFHLTLTGPSPFYLCNAHKYFVILLLLSIAQVHRVEYK